MNGSPFPFRVSLRLRREEKRRPLQAAVDLLFIESSYFVPDPPTPFSLSLAWAAASRAIGTRKGEQLT